MFRFSKDIAHQLRQLRETAQLTQTEVALRMGVKGKFGHSFIVRLEKGKIKHPALETILNYLDAIGVSWVTFFKELSILRSKQNHAEIMSQVKLPVGYRLQKKLDRDTLLYETKIKPPQNFYTKVDLELVKQKVENKVRTFCQNLRIKDELISHYLNFANETCAEPCPESSSGSPNSATPNYKSIIDKYSTPGISKPYLIKIMNIAIKIHHTEEKKVQKQKPLRLKKAKAMAVKYVESRIKLEPIEAEVSKFLAEHNLKDNVLYNSYMNFARECYGKIRKYHIKDPSLLKQHLTEISRAWLRSGLKQEILEKVKEVVVVHFEQIKT